MCWKEENKRLLGNCLMVKTKVFYLVCTVSVLVCAGGVNSTDARAGGFFFGDFEIS